MKKKTTCNNHTCLLLGIFIFMIAATCRAQTGYLHIELQGGYELFHDMSNKSGYDINIGCRYAFNERFFAACTLHGGINNGTYEGIYAGEPTKLDHTMREYMIGAGPGIYLYNGGNKWIYADILAGYGFGEELKASSESQSKSLNGFASAARIGAEYQTKNGWIIGLNAGGYLVGGELRPAINMKFGVFFNL
ncbi:outer membrane beta-barrel protein [Xylanibacter muris]|uniref:Outer membrane beta-barrel protein n=1 Tax=Xylanibacter muris TaxID=2736290 RepID=A0ABX2AIJ5_9BACT|nr:outer membrane beta-barrel protein [Xylanibacter muris]NPD90856.1 outer membrane beta-barrel protein [Xylanibacter muris]